MHIYPKKVIHTPPMFGSRKLMHLHLSEKNTTILYNFNVESSKEKHMTACWAHLFLKK